MELISLFPFSALTLLVRQQEGHPGYLFLVGDSVTGALHDLQLQLSLPLPSSLASIKPVNLGLPGKWPLKRRERELITYSVDTENCSCLRC